MIINLKDEVRSNNDIQSGDILLLRYIENSDNEKENFYVMFIQNNRDYYESYFIYLDDLSITSLDDFISFRGSDLNIDTVKSLLTLDEFKCELLEIIPHENIELRRI